MIPAWKIRRELDTLRQQLQALPELLIGPLRKKWLDLSFPNGFFIADGVSPLRSKVAIFLVFQPRGVPSSVLSTCRHLTDKGYSVLMVCNSRLTEMDRRNLDSCVWRFVERSNFGYDFGGYQDGIRLLWSWGVSPEVLVVLNDSVWFPLDSNELMLDEMEQSPAGFLGALRHVDSPGVDDEHAGFFLSYFFLFKKSVMASQVFIDYWKNYVPTSNKYLTVRRGERGFSRALFAARLSSEGLYSRDRFLNALESQSSAVLDLTLRYGAYTDPLFEQQRDRLLAQVTRDENWRLQVLEHIRLVVAKRNFHSSFCYASVGLLGIPFLKKNRGELQIRMRSQYVRAVKAGDLPSPDFAVFEEIESAA
jgi:Rhamnan synthesis protein F